MLQKASGPETLGQCLLVASFATLGGSAGSSEALCHYEAGRLCLNVVWHLTEESVNEAHPSC